MNTKNRDEITPTPDNWELHKELTKEYARRRAIRNGKTLHQLVAEANAPKLPYRRRPRPRPRKNGRP